jgi:hypothetical protein
LLAYFLLTKMKDIWELCTYTLRFTKLAQAFSLRAVS